MQRKYWLILLGVVALGWVTYAAIFLIYQNRIDPFETFGKEDNQVLIINQKSEYKPELLSFSTIPKNQEILALLTTCFNHSTRTYVSATRMNILVESKIIWDIDKVISTLKKHGQQPIRSGNSSIRLNGFDINVRKNHLHFYGKNTEVTPIDGWKNFDKKASVSIIEFEHNKAIIKDVYIKGNYKLEYQIRAKQKVKGRQINDKQLFGNILPRSLRHYHFMEKEYAQDVNPWIKRSVLSQWMDEGLVLIQYKGKPVLVTDIKTGQSPLALLDEKTGTTSNSTDHAVYKNLGLSKWLPDPEKNGIHVFLVNGFAVLSADEQVCLQLITEQKMGNTLSVDDHSKRLIFHDLPAKVTERKVNFNEKYSRTVYGNLLIETHLLVQPINTQNESYAEGETFTIHVDATVKDFIALNGKGNVLVLTATGELINYTNGQTTWIRNIGSNPVGKLSYLEDYQMILVTSKSGIHLVDLSGKYVYNGPIRITAEPAQQASHAVWQRKLYLVYPDRSGTIHMYGSKREKVMSIPSGISNPHSPVLGWISQNRLFLGIHNESQFVMLDADRRNSYRSFSLNGTGVSLINDNEIVLFTSEAAGIQHYNQKGTKTGITPTINGRLYRTAYGRLDNYIINRRGGALDLLDANGYYLGKIALDFDDVSAVDVQVMDGKTFVSVVDGIENNVYLYRSNGSKLNQKPLEGSLKGMLSLKNGKLILTTVVDKYIIQYDINR
jgi:hypothetical protein